MSATVLVIDDSLTIRKLLEMVLTQAGQRVEFAANGGDGLAAARRLRPALVLLDYVLPDRTGSEVCAALAGDPDTAAIPIVIMSGKGQDIRPLFRAFSAVAGFLDKPFSPASALDVVTRHLGAATARTPTPSAPVAVLPPVPVERAGDPRERLAQTLYRVLAERFARIPAWTAELGAQPAAPFFARRLLTPEAMGVALQALPEVLGTAPAPPATADRASDAAFAGSTRVGGVRALLHFLAEAGVGGELTLGAGDAALAVHLQHGLPTLVAPASPEPVLRALAAAGHHAGADPALPPALAAVAGLPEELAAELLHGLGIAALARAAGAGPMPFALALGAAPTWLSRWARVIEPEQVALARLREIDDWAQIELRVASLDQVCERAPGFAALLPRLALDDAERRVLHLVDGRARVAHLVERSGMSTFDVFHVLFRLIQVGLVRARGAVESGAALLTCGDGLAGPLGALLAARRGGVTVRGVDPAELPLALARERPRAVLVDAAGVDAPAIAAAVRARLEISDAVLVALVDGADPEEAQALTRAGFDGVLARPLHVADLERLLGG